MKLASSSEFQQGYARNEREKKLNEFSYAIPVLSFRIDCKGQLDPWRPTSLHWQQENTQINKVLAC
jgi:hypothetical protein